VIEETQIRTDESGGELIEVCRTMQERLVLYAADEADEAERRGVEAHVRTCSSCAAVLIEEWQLIAAIVAEPPKAPDAHLLANCRAMLGETLDREEAKRPANRLASLFGRGWFGMRLAVSAALLVVVGFLAGRIVPVRGLGQSSSSSPVNAVSETGQANTAAGMLNPQEVHSTNVAGITQTPSSGDAPPNVQVQLNTQQPVVVQGTVNNDNVKNALLSTLQAGNHYGPDVRLQSVELLKPRCGDADVSQAMCRLLRTDPNAAVRLKALDALSGATPSEQVEQAMLDALRQDSNPGVRVEAVNALLGIAHSGQPLHSPEDIQIVRDRMQRDPNNYVRLQSAALVQDSEPR
jgi:anti-sigma factor RsiW